MRIIRNLKHLIKKYIGKAWLKNHCSDNQLILICNWGIGDCLFVEFFMKQIYEKYKKIIIVLCKDYTAPVFLNDSHINKVIGNTRIAKWVGYYCKQTGDVFSEKHIYCHFTPAMDPHCSKYDSIVKDYYYDILQLEGDCSINYPKYLSNFELKSNYIISKKSILICPYSNSGELLSMSFWSTLVNELIELGYQLYTNVNGINEKALENTKPFTERIDRLAAISELFGSVISVRNGICDLLACTSCNLIVINSVNKETKEMWNSKWDINKFSKKKVDIIDYSRETENDIVLFVCNNLNNIVEYC